MKDKYLFVTDFDKTLSLEDSGYLLADKINIAPDVFEQKIQAVCKKNLVQLGGELAYLITSDPDFQGKITRPMLEEVGKETKLKKNVKKLVRILREGIDGRSFAVFVASAAPKEIVASALSEIIPADRIYGTNLSFDRKGLVKGLERTGAGDAKVNILDHLKIKEKVPRDRIIYVGDGISDIRVMLHVQVYQGYPIAVSSSSYLGHIANRTVISDNALSVLIPILEDVLGYSYDRITEFYLHLGLPISEWKRAKIEWVDLVD
jgi:HAD superfamily phosphoserine phosphatase-like hydrolase